MKDTILFLAFLSLQWLHRAESQLDTADDRMLPFYSESELAKIFSKYLSAEPQIEKINYEEDFFASIWEENSTKRKRSRSKRWLVLKKKYNITTTSHTVLSPCNISQVLWPDECERAAEPNENRMKCTTIDPGLPAMCVCKKILINSTHMLTMRFDAAKGICLSPQGSKCTHRWTLNKTEKILFEFGDQQCEQPPNVNRKNEVRCSFPNPRRFTTYPSDVAYCLKLQDSLDSFEEIRFSEYNRKRQHILTEDDFRDRSFDYSDEK